ncbi:MAG: sulfite exporter TauE/SafE family protein [Planctomycetota bacterium]
MLADWALWQFVVVAFIGGLAGTLGGMLGVGGSVIMIPALTLVFGRDQHLYQAAAMAVNVCVAVPAALRHRRAGAVLPAVLKWLLPGAVVFVLVGVALSNAAWFAGDAGGVWLGRLLAVFLVYVVWVNVGRLRREFAAPTPEPATVPLDSRPQPSAHASPARCLGVGGVMGTIAGLLGIGGGAIAVPLQQTVLRLPLRNAIANATAVISVSAALGAAVKLATLGQHSTADRPLSWHDGLLLAACLAPTAFLGGRLGATLTHALPIRWVRLAFVLLMVAAAARMAF